jgi:hypothetical protein
VQNCGAVRSLYEHRAVLFGESHALTSLLQPVRICVLTCSSSRFGLVQFGLDQSQCSYLLMEKRLGQWTLCSYLALR